MKKIITFILAISLFVFSPIAFASVYYVVGYDTNGTASHGTYAYSYVMVAPSVANKHVSSVYAISNGWYSPYAESGWCVHSTNPSVTYFFTAYNIGGYATETHWMQIPRGSNHAFSVQNIQGTNKWMFNYDSSNVQTVDLGVSTLWSTNASERNVSGDTNYSHFWENQKLGSTWTWQAYTNLQLLPSGDNDPDYYFLKYSNQDWYSTR